MESLYKKIEEEMNNLVKGIVKRQPMKKRHIRSVIYFFSVQDYFKRMVCNKNIFYNTFIS